MKDSDKDEAFFYDSQKNNWLQNASNLRQQVIALSGRERAAEVRAGEWTLATASSGVTPSVSVPPPAADPVVGQWMYEGRSPLALRADHSVDGARQGT